MKNKILILLSVLVCLAMVGCGDIDAEKSTDNDAVEVSDSLTVDTSTTTVSLNVDEAEELSYTFWAYNPSKVHAITDTDIINKINTFSKKLKSSYTAESESREESVDIPKGGQIKITISKGNEKIEVISISTPNMERVILSDYSGEENTGGYYYTDNNITSDFYNEMIDYARSQGWVG